MARKKDISYFTDLNTDEELEKFLRQRALISEREKNKSFIAFFCSIFLISSWCLSGAFRSLYDRNAWIDWEN